MPIRILIADDHRLLRAGLKTLLTVDPNLTVTGEATTCQEAVLLARQQRPDIVLLDMSMPDGGGLDVIGQIVREQPGTRVLMLTMHEDSMMVQECLRAGASGYIIKRAAESELVDAIYAVWRGMIYVHPSLMQVLVTPIPPRNAAPEPEREPLTARETEILGYIVKGYTNRQIAEELKLSVRTVETHRSNVMDKLNLHSRVELVRYAQEHHLKI